MTTAKAVFWASFGGLAWTHVVYPVAAQVAARLRSRPVSKDPAAEPPVTVIVAAHNEEGVIERRLDNLLALDYPPDKLAIVVASDASTDETNRLVAEAAAREPRVRLVDCPRGGKVAAQDRAVRLTKSAVVAFSDANASWAPDALRRLVANLADPEVGYVCGQLRLEAAEGANREGVYWRYEMQLREAESQLGSITGGNGSIYALNRADYVEVDPRGVTIFLSVSNGSGWAPRCVRTWRARLRKADPFQRDGVPPQGANVRALLGDHAAGLDVQGAAAELI